MSHFRSLRLISCFPVNANKCTPLRKLHSVPMKKFYKNVYVTESDGKYEINLDKRKLKTPLGKVLLLPNEALANAVASEWEMQHEKLQIHNMHLTALCKTVIDNPTKQSKASLVDSILQYLETDTLCYRYSDPPELMNWQTQQWDPVVSWFTDRFKVKISICESVIGVPVPSETMDTIRKHLMYYNNWSLTGLHFATECLKSLILALGVVHQAVDVQKAVELSRLEVAFQISKWGNIEWSHDLEKMHLTSRVAAAALFIYLNEETTHFTKKSNGV